jgi:hypothetical protein
MDHERYWVVDGICQVCLGDCWQHYITSENGVAWCDPTETVGHYFERMK